MSGLFGDDDNAAEKILQRVAPGRTLIEAAGPADATDDPESARRTIIASPEPVADRPTQEQLRDALERLKRDLTRDLQRKQGIDIDDVDRERLARRKLDDNKTETQKEREGNAARRLREEERRMREGLDDPRRWDPRNWPWTHPRNRRI